MTSTIPSSENGNSLFCSIGSVNTAISNDDLRHQIDAFLTSRGERRDVLILPPDFTRFHSQAGLITQYISEYYNFTLKEKNAASSNSSARSDGGGDSSDSKEEEGRAIPTTCTPCSPAIQIIPALGTHAPMTPSQIEIMFGKELSKKDPNPFIVHNWREDVVTIGHAPAEMVSEATYGLVNEPWPAQLNKLVWDKRIKRNDANYNGNPNGNGLPPLVISVGQVVPHEVLGMANFNKNLFVGVGGVEAINLSHFVGAVHGMEKLMGRGQNPLRSILNYASKEYLQDQLDLWYILTVMGSNNATGEVEMKGLYIGNDVRCYNMACDLSLQVNFNLLPKPPKKMVVYLNEEYHSTWLGNKSIYRTRMAIDDGGELIVMAPHVETFGEDERIDALIRQVGYVGTPAIMEAMEEDKELKSNLSAVAHLIHGSSEGRFSITYCPGRLTREEIESVGFQYASLEAMERRYDVNGLEDGWNTEANEDGVEEEFYYISNPALGLWAVSSRFEDDSEVSTFSRGKDDGASTAIASNQEASAQSGGVGGWKRAPSSKPTRD
mmetsp:Transcript_39908/g.86025  ORF Transcript_39908/g.86025 Transcript_39908/m.86025 type:complete len:550 (-) Transcript_39908:1029-2678(-)